MINNFTLPLFSLDATFAFFMSGLKIIKCCMLASKKKLQRWYEREVMPGFCAKSGQILGQGSGLGSYIPNPIKLGWLTLMANIDQPKTHFGTRKCN